MVDDERRVVLIRYTNYRGETAVRRVLPTSLRFDATQWHPEPQWLMDAFDLERGAMRSFALKDILEWMPREPNQHHNEKDALAK